MTQTQAAGSVRNRLEWERLEIAGAAVIRRQPIDDERGVFSRLFCSEELAHCGWIWPIAQVNFSQTRHKGTIRGLHFQQAPQSDAKLVTCLRGRIWDVVVDLRAGSPTWLQWCARELSAENRTAMLVPPGCAHGFQSLCDDVELVYLHSKPHLPDCEAGIHAFDSRLGVTWPLPVTLMSNRDQGLPRLGTSFSGERESNVPNSKPSDLPGCPT